MAKNHNRPNSQKSKTLNSIIAKMVGFSPQRNYTWGPSIGARLCYRTFIELELGKELEVRW